VSSTLDEVISDGIETAGGWPDGLQFRFPRRDLGSARWPLLGVLAVLLALIVGMIGRAIVGMIRNGVAFGDVMTLVIWLLIAIPLCRLPIWYLIVLLFGHAEIDVRPDSLSAGECLGGWRRSKQWPLYRLMRVQVFDLLPASSAAEAQFRSAIASAKGESAAIAESPQEVRSPFVRHLHALTALLNDGKRIILALAYPKPLLENFAQQLAQQIANARKQLAEDGSAYEARLVGANSEAAAAARRTFEPPPSSVETAPAIGLSELIGEAKEAMRKRAEPDVFDQPPGSNIQVDWLDDGGITFRIPPTGVWKGSGGTFQVGLLFAIVTAGFTTLFAGAGIAQGQGGPGIWGAIGIMSIFWLASGGILYAGWMMGTRESAVAVVGDRVMVMQTGLRRARRREWPRREVKTARVGASGTEINDEPILKLQLHGPDKKLFGMLAGRDARELTWMATLLRQALKSSEPQGPNNTDRARPEQPSSDAAQVAHEASEPPATSRPDSAFNFEGMTIQERLQVARLTDEFAAAAERGDRETMLELLARVQLPLAGAAAFGDEVLADPRRHAS
jgi:hypothetical protein